MSYHWPQRYMCLVESAEDGVKPVNKRRSRRSQARRRILIDNVDAPGKAQPVLVSPCLHMGESMARRGRVCYLQASMARYGIAGRQGRQSYWRGCWPGF